MLKIRLSRGGRHKAPFYRIVLTEHTKPVKSGYKEVLGWFNPLQHEVQMDIEAIKEWIGKGAQPSNRVAKLALKESGDKFFEKYVTHSDRKRRGKNAPEEEEVTEAPVEETPAAEDAPSEETPSEDETAEEATQEEKAE